MKKLAPVILLVVIIVALAAGGYYYLKNQGSYTPATNESVMHEEASPISSPDAMMDEGEARNITLTGKEFSFEPPKLTVKAGEKINLTLKNNGNAPHTFAIEGTSVTTPIVQPGKETTITFSMDTAGKYTFFCSVAGHKDAGMQGDLIVQ